MSLFPSSDVESQESCGHFILSDTLFPRSFSSFSAWIKGTNKRTKNGHKYACKHGYKYGYRSSGFHSSLRRTVYTQDSDGNNFGAVQPKITINALNRTSQGPELSLRGFECVRRISHLVLTRSNDAAAPARNHLSVLLHANARSACSVDLTTNEFVVSAPSRRLELSFADPRQTAGSRLSRPGQRQ